MTRSEAEVELKLGQPSDVVELALPPAQELTSEVRVYLEVCQDKLGLIPNVMTAHLFSMKQINGFVGFYNELMLGESGLSKLEREMIAVVVSAHNHCHYCCVAHGAAVRGMTGDPEFSEALATNYRGARCDPRQRAMLDFAAKVTTDPDRVEGSDRERLREAGFSERDIWDISYTASFFNMSNRMATAVGMKPNPEYQSQHR